ncbi:glycosyl hydrolase family 1 [Stenotrophomonas sp. Betaine-02u-21]|uniref:glycosyltransferase n=1 Tax=unclassified Stenotrophomonas TaxID=196198 RepID=UPI000C32E81E|nr:MULTISPECIES: glycosyltransferase [unclassified Stenotrophomonas]PKH70110.1 glycosyl hydrolase family 1 [Stenotrophomonas sp. Betaine-02u-23]PKH74331.1 glycosyl hydrolase family 1 [Stenotrophomonas sp. Betaine-02u-21]PKH96540.1 glycosyl hydrolase family 1 [Stenotrophomonas sp. Bg11-02]
MKSGIHIGVSRSNYPVERCITSHDWATFIDLEKFNTYRYINQVQKLLGRKRAGELFRDCRPFTDRRISGICLFNEVALTSRPWASVFETVIPRMDEVMAIHRLRDEAINYPRNPRVERRLRSMCSDNCLAINALSKSAFNIQSELLRSYPELQDVILRKMRVTHPPQPILTLPGARRYREDTFNVIFVGNDFYRKGGAELVIALDEFMSDEGLSGRDLSVTLIGDLTRRSNYALNGFQDSSIFAERVEKLISKREFAVKKGIPNSQVLALMAASSLGFLPTWADTYGYSVLEMQSCGTPVVTTNVRALPEINFAELLINVPLNRLGEIVVESRPEAERFRAAIIEGIKVKLRHLYYDRSALSSLSERSVARVRDHHDPNTYFESLSNLFKPA